MGTGRIGLSAHSKRYYEKHKEEVAVKNKEYHKKYYQRPEVKLRQRINVRELKKLSKEIGNCPSCFKPNPEPKYSYCPKCREYHKNYCKRKNESKNIKT